MLCPVPTTLPDIEQLCAKSPIPSAPELFPVWPAAVLSALLIVLAICVVVMECMRMRRLRR